MIPPLFAVGNAALHIFEATRQRRLEMSFEYRHIDQEVSICYGLAHAKCQVVSSFLDDFILFRIKQFQAVFLCQRREAATVKCTVGCFAKPRTFGNDWIFDTAIFEKQYDTFNNLRVRRCPFGSGLGNDKIRFDDHVHPGFESIADGGFPEERVGHFRCIRSVNDGDIAHRFFLS